MDPVDWRLRSRQNGARGSVVHVWTSGNRGLEREALIVLRSGRCRPAVRTWRRLMARFVGLDVSQKLSSVCVVDDTGGRVWRGQCSTDPGQIGERQASCRMACVMSSVYAAPPFRVFDWLWTKAASITASRSGLSVTAVTGVQFVCPVHRLGLRCRA